MRDIHTRAPIYLQILHLTCLSSPETSPGRLASPMRVLHTDSTCKQVLPRFVQPFSFKLRPLSITCFNLLVSCGHLCLNSELGPSAIFPQNNSVWARERLLLLLLHWARKNFRTFFFFFFFLICDCSHFHAQTLLFGTRRAQLNFVTIKSCFFLLFLSDPTKTA